LKLQDVFLSGQKGSCPAAGREQNRRNSGFGYNKVKYQNGEALEG